MDPLVGRRMRNPGAALIVIALALVAVGPPSIGRAASPRGAVGDPVDAGEVVVVDSLERSRELVEGVGATEFSLMLPDGASCPGDSLHDQWRIQSFVVPASVDPTELQYELIAPKGEGRYALYGVDTVQFTQGFTFANDVAGEPGLIPAIPPLSFAVFPPGTLPAGRYRIGIACTYFRETATVWDTQIVVTTNPDDQPAQLAWRVAEPSATAVASESGSGTAPLVGIGLAAVGLLAVVLMMVRARAKSHQLKEQS